MIYCLAKHTSVAFQSSYVFKVLPSAKFPQFDYNDKSCGQALCEFCFLGIRLGSS